MNANPREIPKKTLDKFRYTTDGLLYIQTDQEVNCKAFDDNNTIYYLTIRRNTLIGMRLERTQEFTMLRYLKKLKNKNLFIETGTDQGEMIKIVRNEFKKIISIEADKDKHEKAKEKFKDSHIKLIHGDSGKLVPTEADLYWLDAHSAPGKESICPLMEELKRIEKFEYILIDDAVSMTGVGQFPNAFEIGNFIKEKWGITCTLENGIIVAARC